MEDRTGEEEKVRRGVGRKDGERSPLQATCLTVSGIRIYQGNKAETTEGKLN